MTAVQDRARALAAPAAVPIALAGLVAVEAADLARAVDGKVLDALRDL